MVNGLLFLEGVRVAKSYFGDKKYSIGSEVNKKIGKLYMVLSTVIYCLAFEINRA